MITKMIFLNTYAFVCVVLWGSAMTTLADGPKVQYWYQQPLDHFGSKGGGRTRTFGHRYYVDRAYRDNQADVDGMSVMAYLGGESSVDDWVGGGGIVTVAAARLHALVVYIEHRFYGKSIPLGSIHVALADPEVRSCLTSEQALADFANVLRTLKVNLSIPSSPIITFGGSYAGMLAARFRMKYPNITNGSLASSAPILISAALPLKRQYCSIVSRDFESESEVCYQYISRSWGLINKMASQSDGLDKLSKTFSTCSPLPSAEELKTYLAGIYNFVAQYNGRFGRISQLCGVVSHASDNILKSIGDAVLRLTQGQKCNNMTGIAPKPFTTLDPASETAWDWQWCNELAPYQSCGQDTMFERSSSNQSLFSESCFNTYGTYPHPLWNSTGYSGHDLKNTSNIIFSNGLLDPYSGASILEDVSESIIAITTKEGSHCLDLIGEQDDDPKWLKDQRDKELKIIAKWINAKLSSSNRLLISVPWRSSILVALVIMNLVV
ncbi:hypothetical protein RND81_02G240100 [Saponaria officinalis]|uniref:Uncharacterized protein n=1 Tax=Saponaria officinalis TaxID=3572 RepID=A0AAW1MPD5_SAPOF